MTRPVPVLAVLAALLLATLGLGAGTKAQDDNDDFDDLQATAAAHEEALEGQRTEIADLEATTAAHEATIEAQQTEIAELEERVAAVETAGAQATRVTNEPTERPAGVATPVPEAVLYAADATGGLDEWTGSADWQHRDGDLVNDGTASASVILAPYQPGDVSDYAVEAEIRVLRCPGEASFGLVARAEEQGAYWAGYRCGTATTTYGVISAVEEGGGGTRLAEQSVDVDAEWHTYRLEVQGDTLRLLVDGALLMETGDVRYVDGGQVGLWSHEATIRVRSFRVLAL